MQVALVVVGLVVTVAVVAGLARRLGWSAPLCLLGVGVVGSYVPGIPQVELAPEVVLVGLLPPLLYAAAIRTSLVDFRANRTAIALLSVGLVAFSTVVVGAVTWWVLPAVGVAAAMALGAVVAPPDAVAATAVGRRVGMPRRIVSILEGESLVNDATALVALNSAIAALTTHVTAVQVGLGFLLAAGGGLVVGIAVAALLALVRKHVDDPVLDTTLSFVAPWVAFLPAQKIHASGVLAVVVTGLLLGHKSPVLQSGASRLAEATNWRTVQFVLENVVFLLIGLQLRGIVEGLRLDALGVPRLTGICLAVLATVILARIVWVMGAVAVWRGLPPLRVHAWRWSEGALVSWAGMRGVVTLAAALVLPQDTPAREVLLLAAFVVVAGTLLAQGLTLPYVVRRLGLPGPDAAEDALQEASLVSEASQAGLAELERSRGPDDPEEVLDQLRDRAARRTNVLWERLGRAQTDVEPPGATYVRLRLKMLQAERGAIVRARDAGTADDEVLRRAMAAVDTEESLLDRVEDAQARVDSELVTPRIRAVDCEHLQAAPRVRTPRTPQGCEECLRDGTTWVHLRLCLECGHVGCCDSSQWKHAAAHFHETDHPVMRSFEPGEAWRWCFVDEHLG